MRRILTILLLTLVCAGCAGYEPISPAPGQEQETHLYQYTRPIPVGPAGERIDPQWH